MLPFGKERFGFLWGGDPVDFPAGTFQAAEEGELALGVVPDSGLELGEHLFTCELVLEHEGDVSVLESEVLESFPADSFCMQARDFFDHALIHAFLEADFDIAAERFFVGA